MSNVTYLKSVRTRFRNTLTIEMQKASNVLDEEISSNNIDHLISETKKCCEKIKSYIMKVENQSEKLASAIEESDPSLMEEVMEEDCSLCSIATDKYLELELLNDKLIKAKEKELKSTEVVDDKLTLKIVNLQEDMQKLLHSQMKQNEMKLNTEKEHQSSVKLPKLEMTSFNGEKTKWKEFWDSFQCAVHDNKVLSNIEKFNYLRSKLTGDAKTAIGGLALSDGNYLDAVDILTRRFGNVQEIVDLHYKQLITLRSATTSVYSLRNMLDKIGSCIRSLDVLKQNVNQDVFVSIIKSKLPEDVILQLEMKKSTDTEWTISLLIEQLENYVIARERAMKDSVMENRHPENNSRFHHDRHPTHGSNYNRTPKTSHNRVYNRDSGISFSKPSYQSLVTSSSQQKQTYNKPPVPFVKKCRYCDQQHWSDECKQYHTLGERKERIKGSCFRCLREGHSFKNCKTNKSCVYCGKSNAHHRSLCPNKFQEKRTITQFVSEGESPENKTNASLETMGENNLMSTNEMVLMQTAFTSIQNPETYQTAPVRIFLDSGSHRSYITETLAKQLNLTESGEEDIHLVTFGNKEAKRVTTKYVDIDIKLKNNNYARITANVVPVISGELHRRPIDDLWSDYSKDMVASVQLADTMPTHHETAPIELLIGNDYYLDFVIGEKIKVQDGLYLLASTLGWILSGRVNDVPNNVNNPCMLILTSSDYINTCTSNTFSTIDASLPVKPDLESFWNLDSIGIIDGENTNDDVMAMEDFRDSLQFEDNRYQVKWPWKDTEPDLPTNKELAFGRLSSVIHRMRHKPEVLQKYNQVIKDQLDRNIIEKVQPTDIPDGLVHYLPHHAVMKSQNSTTKLRVVYDASARTRKENHSLNDCLFRGPLVLNDLCGLLMRFRLHNIAIIADIEKAFLQIGLQKDQRDVTRFMWIKDINKPLTDSANIQEYRFCRVPFGVVSSPFLLGATLEHHLDSYQNDVADKIKGDLYVDNLVTGTHNVKEAKLLYKNAKTMFQDGSMNLREWVSNNKEVNDCFMESDRVDKKVIHVLGHNWDFMKDDISFQTLSSKDQSLITKRSILKQVASIFDPLGLLCPVTLKGKLFLQYLWKQNIQWDEKLSDSDCKSWLSIERDFCEISEFHLARCISDRVQKPKEYRLVCFCDASQRSYATAIYLHQTLQNNAKSDLIFAKTRLAPVKGMSIPRLELLAIMIGVRCLKYVKNKLSLPITQSYLFSDSQCVLYWIKSEKPLSVFVRNRVKEIKTFDGELGYVPTALNPADIATRETSIRKLSENHLWWNGPSWLSKQNNEWRRFDHVLDDNSKSKYESEIQKEKTDICVLTQLTSKEYKQVIDVHRFSSLTKLLRVTVLVLRFVKQIRKRPCTIGFITASEIEEAELYWLKSAQKDEFSDVFQAINDGKQTNIQNQLGLYIDQSDILRCRGRLQNAGICESARYPILLPRKHRYTELVVDKLHKELSHCGVSQTLAATRQRYWIPHGRATVKSILKNCTICRRYEGGSYKLPPMCSYPRARVTESSPFSHVGLDYMGPLHIKTDKDRKKVWICLFTCLVTRAIHLELVTDMTTAEFLLCFRRFIAQRGTPYEIISDNSLTFHTASNIIENVWKQIHDNDDVYSYVTNAGITWKFNVELAPWMGGFYERLVGVVKRSLRKTIGRRVFTLIQLQTLLKEIESGVNSRPLVYVGEDINSNIPLTPAHFLTHNCKTGIPEMDISQDDDYRPTESTKETLINLWKKGQRLLDMFWKVWNTEYLLSLRERTQKYVKDGRIHSNFQPKENDVVLIKEDLPRGCWRFGKITKLIKSKDGLIRSVKLITSSGRTIGRPINLLYPLEASHSEHRNEDKEQVQKSCKNNEGTHQNKKQFRLSAKQAKEKISEIINSEREITDE